MKKDTPVLLLTGYLGSGKTTLLNRILANRRGIRFAVIVNDIGEVNIDATLIKKEGIVGMGKDATDLVALQNGCICCTLKMDLVQQLAELISSQQFDYIVIEASGICEPAPIAQTIATFAHYVPPTHSAGAPRLDCVATVVDALRLKSEFDSGDSLTHKEIGEEEIENLIIEQIEFCDIVLLNKVSEVSPGDAAHIKAVIHALQPRAEIIECDYCDVDLDKLIDTHKFDFEATATSATWVREIEGHNDHGDDDDDHHHHHHHHHHDEEGEAEEYGIQTFVYFARQGFDMNRFDYFIASQWPANVIRTKGLLYFSQNSDMSYIFEQAGTQKKLTEAGYWYATAPAEELEQLMEREPGLARDWDATYGDRMVKLVFIGRDLDRGDITAKLDACLDPNLTPSSEIQ